MNLADTDLERLRAEYVAREQRFAGSDIYSPFNPANLFMRQQRQRFELALLNRYGFKVLSGKRVLEIGCGRGEILREYMGYGVAPENIHGIDLLFDRLNDARGLQPKMPLICADGQHIPFRSGTFDLILQYTAFSSILDDRIKRLLANEMLRVLRKPGGLIVWYDFWLNPMNKQTRGIRPSEIKALFSGCLFKFYRITLAPPIARRVVSFSWPIALFLENIRLFNSHYLVAIQPES